MKNIAIILAAGTSKRCGFDKIFYSPSPGLTPVLIEQTLRPFQDCKSIDEIILVLNTAQEPSFEALKHQFPKIKSYCAGGSERFDSLRKALETLTTALPLPPENQDLRIIVHNGANPHVTVEDLTLSIKDSQQHPNLIFGYFSPNSIKKVVEGKVVEYLDRDEIFETQTPQISTLRRLQKALEKWESNPQKTPRDEAELLSLIDEEVCVYECSVKNQKITYPEDFGAHSLDSAIPSPSSGLLNLLEPGLNQSILFGVGEDSHRFASQFDPQKPVVLGGVKLPESQLTFDANSDGDVIIHSLCNALLNAIGAPTFDTFATPMCRAGIIDSVKYFEETLKILKNQEPNAKIQQVRISLEGLVPKIAPNHHEIVNNLARILNIEVSNIGLTYTTGEALTSFGKGDGMRCTTYVIITKTGL
ncbi:MAG TPA: 2-C-methyl-D-erythritol 2,4-cyclodiphosphate synthase [Candidatus Gracilibacteria bacterium]